MPKVVLSFFLHGKRKFLKAVSVGDESLLTTYVEAVPLDIAHAWLMAKGSEDPGDHELAAFLYNYTHYDHMMVSGVAQ